jgi:hypothetical protein
MRSRLKLALTLLFTSASCLNAQNVPPVNQDGLVVGQPKIYDTFYLQQQLLALRSQLERLQVLDRTSLVNRFGNVQGASLVQNGVAVQASGPSTPTTTTTTGGDSPGTQVATTPLAAANPTVAATNLTLPTPSMGASDTLAEEVQLQYQITNLELLLDGAVSDRITPTGQPRRAVTIGFPVSIQPPNQLTAGRRSNSVAEVMVSLCRTTSDPNGRTTDVSIGTLLPQEHTYNVAGLVDKSFSASVGGVLGGVLSVGGGFLHRKQKFFLVQQQETVAFQTTNSLCTTGSSGPSFTWQIRPVLGSKQVRSGMQTNFVQFSLDDLANPVLPTGEILNACVSLGWSRTSAHGSIVQTPAQLLGVTCFPVIQYSSQLRITRVDTTNLAGSDLAVKAHGTFEPGTTLKVGATVLAAEKVVISPDASSLEATIPAADIVKAGGVSLLARDGTERSLQNQKGHSGDKPIANITVTATPRSNVDSQITISFDESVFASHAAPCSGIASCEPRFEPWIVVAGGKIYGLADSPFLSNSASRVASANAPVRRVLQLNLPTVLLHSGQPIVLERPLYDPELASVILPNATFVTATAAQYAPSIEKVTILSAADKSMELAVTGSNLDTLQLLYPIGASNKYTSSQPGFAEITLNSASAKVVKQIVLCRRQGMQCDPTYAPLLVDIPKSNDATTPTAPKLKDGASVTVGSTTVILDGTQLNQIVLFQYAGQKLTFRVTGTESSQIVLDLPSSIYSRKGTYPLVTTTADGKTSLYTLIVK